MGWREGSPEGKGTVRETREGEKLKRKKRQEEKREEERDACGLASFAA
jgi:hypothetical protein